MNCEAAPCGHRLCTFVICVVSRQEEDDMSKIKAILLAMAMVATLSGLAVAQNGNYNDDNRYQRDRDDDYRGNHRNDDNDNRRWGRDRNDDAREYGFHNGYRAGFMQGRSVRNSRGRYGNWNNGQWGNSTGNQ